MIRASSMRANQALMPETERNIPVRTVRLQQGIRYVCGGALHLRQIAINDNARNRCFSAQIDHVPSIVRIRLMSMYVLLFVFEGMPPASQDLSGVDKIAR